MSSGRVDLLGRGHAGRCRRPLRTTVHLRAKAPADPVGAVAQGQNRSNVRHAVHIGCNVVLS